MSLVRIYGRASWCSTRFSVRFREGSGSWAMLYRFSGVLSIGLNVQSKSCREATCMHFELSVPTVLHARKACAHTALLGNISFLTDCILVPSRDFFNNKNIIFLQDPNDLKGARGKLKTLEYLVHRQSFYNYLIIRYRLCNVLWDKPLQMDGIFTDLKDLSRIHKASILMTLHWILFYAASRDGSQDIEFWLEDIQVFDILIRNESFQDLMLKKGEVYSYRRKYA